MGGEPWCFTPAEIGSLTDWQIWELYVRPAVRRQEATRDAGKRPRLKKAPGDGIPDREEYIELGLHMQIPREHLEREYDAWAATPEAQALFAKREARKGGRR